MKLTQPTDFEILEELSDGNRDVAANLACKLNQKRPYLNTRLPILLDYGLVERIGPSDNSGLYEITRKGELAVAYQDRYSDSSLDFEAFLEDQLE